jgi:hypothetical protein
MRSHPIVVASRLAGRVCSFSYFSLFLHFLFTNVSFQNFIEEDPNPKAESFFSVTLGKVTRTIIGSIRSGRKAKSPSSRNAAS